NQLSLAFAGLSGISLAGVGLSWKGWPYVAGIMLLFGLVQLLANHWRRKDNTHLFFIILVTLLVGIVVSLPYYLNPQLSAVFDTLLPMVFILVGWIVLGAIFTASRDMPFVLVLPLVLLAGLLTLVLAFVALPSVAQSLLAPLVYFRQTKLYTTIAEAHPADFDTMVFGMGVVGFFFAIGALVYLIWGNRKAWGSATTFMAVWGVVAIFMAESAVRFLANAVPVFALLGGYGISLIVDRLDFASIGKNLAGFGGVSRDALKRSVNAWHVLGAVLLALLLIFPNVMLAVDAAIPPKVESQFIADELRAKGLPDTSANRKDTFIQQRFGAFGQDFISDYWKNLFEWLQHQDSSLPAEQRPAFLSWWDYGHWAISLGHHPAVADNFQNGYSFAGHFIVAQNETEAVQLFIAREMDRVKAGQLDQSVITNALQQAGVTDPQAAYASLSTYSYSPAVDLAQAVKALGLIEAQTQNHIRYFAADVRLFPYDNPQTPSIDFGSIFYAPVTLSDHNPDDYVEAIIRANVPGQTDPVTHRPKTEFTVAEWSAIQHNLVLASQIQGQPFQIYKYKEPFFNSMFYRTYIGTPVGFAALPATSCDAPAVSYPVEGDSLPGLPMPGFCLSHFRVVYLEQSVRMLQYYPGATLQGTVNVDGQPMAGATVIAYDDAGGSIYNQSVGLLTDTFKSSFRVQHGRDLAPGDFDVPHDSATTDASGTYRLILPFSTTGQVHVRAFKDGVELGNASLAISQAQAEQGFAVPTAQGLIAAQSGSVTGKVYFDRDGNRQLNGTGDRGLSGAQLILDHGATNVTSGSDGTFTLPRVAPGQHTLAVTLNGYDQEVRAEDAPFSVRPGQAATNDVALVLAKVAVDGTTWRDNNTDNVRQANEGVPQVRLRAQPDFRQADNTALPLNGFSQTNGTLSLSLSPGQYILRGESQDGLVFGAARGIAQGAGSLTLPDNLTKLVPGAPATLNLTLVDSAGNVTGAAGASVLLEPTSGGLWAGDVAAQNGTLLLHLAPGTYTAHVRHEAGGAVYTATHPSFVVSAAGGSVDIRLAQTG
ncbi:MAG: carboxypeptidase regulatory-like domain-containing protein, partial [Halobacteriales archaeon]|nr:carboxypeptidase regulatory-like domain-containing protein [Halobacteriales archaeon]